MAEASAGKCLLEVRPIGPDAVQAAGRDQALQERRTVVSCYSWPGVRPEPCMHVYGSQLAPLLERLVSAGGLDGIRPDGSYFEQALARGSLRHWHEPSGSVAPVVAAGVGA